MEYKVLGNLEHDRVKYSEGDVVELTAEQAAPLIEVGAIEDPEAQEEGPKVGGEKPKTAKAKGKENGPKVGGEKPKTGEPSIDSEREGKADTARDITPKVEEDPSKNL